MWFQRAFIASRGSSVIAVAMDQGDRIDAILNIFLTVKRNILDYCLENRRMDSKYIASIREGLCEAFQIILQPAQAVWTFAVQGKSTTTIPRDLLLVALELLVGITSGAYFAALLVIREACEPAAPPRGHARQGGRARDKHEIDSPLAAFVRLIWGLGGIALMALALIIIGAFWTWLATSLLRSGVVIGAAAAVFGAMLETLLHTGEDVVGPLHWTMACAVKRILVSLAIVLICAAPLAARAEECTYYITSGPNDKVESEPPHAHPEGEPRWRPWERVHVKANTSIRVRPAEGSPDEYTDFPAHQVDISVVLPPCPRKGGAWASWFNFWAAWPPRETKRSEE